MHLPIQLLVSPTNQASACFAKSLGRGETMRQCRSLWKNIPGIDRVKPRENETRWSKNQVTEEGGGDRRIGYSPPSVATGFAFLDLSLTFGPQWLAEGRLVEQILFFFFQIRMCLRSYSAHGRDKDPISFWETFRYCVLCVRDFGTWWCVGPIPANWLSFYWSFEEAKVHALCAFMCFFTKLFYITTADLHQGPARPMVPLSVSESVQ